MTASAILAKQDPVGLLAGRCCRAQVAQLGTAGDSTGSIPVWAGIAHPDSLRARLLWADGEWAQSCM